MKVTFCTFLWKELMSEVKIYTKICVIWTEIRKNIKVGGCEAQIHNIWKSKPLHRRLQVKLQENVSPDILCSVFLPSREYAEYRTKSSAVAFPLKPLQWSATCVSELPFLKKNTMCSLTSAWFGSSQQRRSDPLHNTYSTSSPKALVLRLHKTHFMWELPTGLH